MPATSTVILGTGAYAPSRIMTNDDLSRVVETSDDWIRTRTGIGARRVAGGGAIVLAFLDTCNHGAQGSVTSGQ